MKLAELFAGTVRGEITGVDGVEVTDLAYDSRRVRPGTLYFCVRGERADGHDFAPEAVKRGAVALVVDRPLDLAVTQVQVRDVRAAMAPVAVRFFGDPTAELDVVGITGTNGKTTTAFLSRRILEAAGTPSGLLGTVKRVVGGVEEEVERTTPEAIDLQGTFRRMLDAGDRACVMEVSSHALALDRVTGVRLAVAAFMNLTQDHLDFHADMEDYFQAKARLFRASPEAEAPGSGWPSEAPGAAVINTDDPFGSRLADQVRAARSSRLLTFSPRGDEDADFRAVDVEFDAAGSRFRCVGPEGEVDVEMPLPGHFNVENALAAMATTSALGVSAAVAAQALAETDRVPGRFEAVDEGQPFTVLVDYAHTPDSLENVLRAARKITEGRLICVFGCGGDRDRAKRPLMGEIAARLSDHCIVTSDNPRSEDPRAIIGEILDGARKAGGGGVAVEPDRRRAIGMSLEGAASGDTVVIAGKGHEQGQEFEDGRTIPFDDRQVAREELGRMASARLKQGA
jgi:UDP-N-acetylmuramoyl-L-alanyl-D-glutamate--2,6-diaminopimelate ligase